MEIDIGSKHFACFLAWDAHEASVEHVSLLIESLLRRGASYFVCWGQDCERVHDIVDEIAAHAEHVPPDTIIMTTWHEGESLEEALWFFLVNSHPDEHYEPSTRAGLVVVVDAAAQESAIAAAIDDPRQFTRRVGDA